MGWSRHELRPDRPEERRRGDDLSRGRRAPKRPCSVAGCGAESTHQCDFKLVGAKAGKTCDRYLCGKHAVRQPSVLRFDNRPAVVNAKHFPAREHFEPWLVAAVLRHKGLGDRADEIAGATTLAVEDKWKREEAIAEIDAGKWGCSCAPRKARFAEKPDTVDYCPTHAKVVP